MTLLEKRIGRGTGKGLDSLLEFGRLYFGEVSRVLNTVSQGSVVYAMPDLAIGERKTDADRARLRELNAKRLPALQVIYEKIESARQAGRPLGREEILILYNGCIDEHMTPAELAEFDALDRKMDDTTGAFYDGSIVVLGPESGRLTIAHELNHALRHQTRGVHEQHSGYSSAQDMLVSAASGGKSLINPAVAEFVGDLAPVIADSLGIPVEKRTVETLDGLERAAEYFEGGFNKKLSGLLDSIAGALAQAERFNLQPTRESFAGLYEEVKRATERVYASANEFMRHADYLALLEKSDVTICLRNVVEAVSVAGSLVNEISANMSAGMPLERSCTVIKDVVGMASSTFLEMREIIAKYGPNPGSLNWDNTGPYKLADMAIDNSRHALLTEWPQVFFMPPAQIEERYFHPLGKRMAQAVERYGAKQGRT